MKINIKEILLTLVLAAILFLLIKLTFFQKENNSGGITSETLIKLDSLERSSYELKQKNSVLEEKIRNFEEENNTLEESKETVKKNFSSKKSKYETLSTSDREAEFKNYTKNFNPEFYNKLYGDK
jgi:cell division protein FtsB